MSGSTQVATVSLSRGAGLLFAVAAAILWSSAGIGIKLLPLPGPAIAGYRALFSLPVFIAALLLRGPRLRQASFYAGALRQPLIFCAGLAYAGCVTLFVLANKQTSAANAILFQYSAPIYVALLSGPLLREPVRGGDWLAVLACLVGIALCFSSELSAAGWLGNGLAMASGLGFGLLPLLWRRMAREPDPIDPAGPAPSETERLAQRDRLLFSGLSLVLGNLLTAAICAPWMIRHVPQTVEQGLALSGLGLFQIGLAYLFYAAAVRRLSAVECLLAVSLEPILNPIWVALWAGERPGRATLLGGAIIIGSVLLRGVVVARRATQPIGPPLTAAGHGPRRGY
ncbi:MAG: DMT family transporter [Myxococcales bacterium]|nr:DMT family transporter [Myxococcales bacterium]